MWKSAAAMLAGTLAILSLPELPALHLLLALCAPLVVAAIWCRWFWLLFLSLGACWCGRLHPGRVAAPQVEGWRYPGARHAGCVALGSAGGGGGELLALVHSRGGHPVRLQIAKPTQVIVSHGDNDHAGGLQSLREA